MKGRIILHVSLDELQSLIDVAHRLRLVLFHQHRTNHLEYCVVRCQSLELLNLIHK